MDNNANHTEQGAEERTPNQRQPVPGQPAQGQAQATPGKPLSPQEEPASGAFPIEADAAQRRATANRPTPTYTPQQQSGDTDKQQNKP